VTTPAPCIAVSLTRREVRAIRISWDGDRPAIEGCASVTLPQNTLIPNINSANVIDSAGLSGAIKDVVQDLCSDSKRVGLVLPDVVAKVALIQFDEVPGRSRDLHQMLGWRMTNGLPFSMDDAQMAYEDGIALEVGQEFVVSIMKRVIVKEYEEVFLQAGIRPGLIDLGTFNVINSVLKVSPEVATGDCLFIQIADEFCTLVVVRDSDVIFFRNRSTGSVDELLELVHQTSMYYRDRLAGAEFESVLLNIESSEQWSLSENIEVRVQLEKRFKSSLTSVGEVLRHGISDKSNFCIENFDSLAAPLGILLRGSFPVA